MANIFIGLLMIFTILITNRWSGNEQDLHKYTQNMTTGKRLADDKHKPGALQKHPRWVHDEWMNTQPVSSQQETELELVSFLGELSLKGSKSYVVWQLSLWLFDFSCDTLLIIPLDPAWSLFYHVQMLRKAVRVRLSQLRAFQTLWKRREVWAATMKMFMPAASLAHPFLRASLRPCPTTDCLSPPMTLRYQFPLLSWKV